MLKKSLGIVGGMGSHATAFFFKRILDLTLAKTDQDFIEIFIHNNTAIPDRTTGILYGGKSPLFELKRSIKYLNILKVDYIILACITSHYFIPHLISYSNATLIDGIDETLKYILKHFNSHKKIGILASTGTIELSLYQNKLSPYGFNCIILGKNDQEAYFMDPIYSEKGVKAGYFNGNPKRKLLKAIDILLNRGADAIISGCTEVPLVLEQKDIPVPLISTIDIISTQAIKKCGSSPK